MDYRLEYTQNAFDDLRRLPSVIASRIILKMKYFASLKDPLSKAKKLKGFEVNTYRFRVGDYRVVFRVDKGVVVVLVVLRVANRKDVYGGK